MIPTDLLPLASHLWQSTLFAAAAWLLALTVRRNRAAVRYGIWMAASVKFLIPFWLLISIGSHVEWRTATPIAQPQAAAYLNDFASFAQSPDVVIVTAAPPSLNHLVPILIGVWLCGVILGLVFWFRSLRQLRAIQRAATPLPLDLPIPARSSPALLEPGVFGIRNPVLILPAGITDRLTPAQLGAVIAHEICHVRRRDNLTAAIHMVVEVIFWFHPLVWWIRTRLVAERERACDEEVVSLAADPEVYAEAILNVCKLYFESPVVCMSGVTGSNLKRRIEAILSDRSALRLNLAKKLALTVAGVAALAAPIVVGLMNAPVIQAQAPQVVASSAPGAAPKFDVASVKPVRGASNLPPDSVELNFLMPTARNARHGQFSVSNLPLRLLIQLAYNVRDFQVLGGPSWARSDRYRVDAKAAGNATYQQMLPMLQSLLADRFKLTLHRETRELPVYELTVAKGGFKIEAAKAGSCVTFDPNSPRPPLNPNRPPQPIDICGGVRRSILSVAPARRDRIEAVGISMPKLIEMLSGEVGATVVDKTGFTEEFDFRLEFASEQTVGVGPEDASPGDPSIFNALQEQLGLRLKPAKGPVEVLVIDHVERPSEN
jgi:bla regulator protein BlaR1